MERKIGEIFKVGDEWYQCVEQPSDYKGCACDICSMNGIGNCELDECSGNYRTDKESVIFKKLEKVGEPFSCNYYGDGKLVIMQEYQLYEANAIYNYGSLPMYISDYKHKRIAIEIKQNKDIEDNKLNLRPFDIQKAREGKPVCTRGGHKVRIICFDYNGETGDYPIVALVSYYKGNNFYERVLKYTSDGLFNKYGDYKHDDDLMMPPERKEGWVNVYKGSVCISVYPRIYKSREEAVSDNTTVNRIDTVKITWEE